MLVSTKHNNEDGQDVEKDEIHESPINISITGSTKLTAPPLIWSNYDVAPERTTIVNTGKTVQMFGTWDGARPCLQAGPLPPGAAYIFYQLHLHWGRSPVGGSLHWVDGMQYCMEMHVAHFQSTYLFPNVAKKHDDGLLILVYLFNYLHFQLEYTPNLKLQNLTENLHKIRQVNSSASIPARPLSELLFTFPEDLFMYRSPAGTSANIIWMLPRYPIGISESQIKPFQSLLDPCNSPIVENNNTVVLKSKPDVYFVNPSPAQFATMHRRL